MLNMKNKSKFWLILIIAFGTLLVLEALPIHTEFLATSDHPCAATNLPKRNKSDIAYGLACSEGLNQFHLNDGTEIRGSGIPKMALVTSETVTTNGTAVHVSKFEVRYPELVLDVICLLAATALVTLLINKLIQNK